MCHRIQLVLVCCGALAAFGDTLSRADESPLALAPAQPVRFALIPPEPIPLPPVDGDQVMTLAEAEALSLANHPAMREAEGLVRAARGEWLQVGLRPNPEIGYLGDEIGNQGRAGFQGGFVSQEFVTAGKLGLNRAVAIRETSAAEQRLERARRQIVTTVRMYYYESLSAERSVAFSHQLLQISSQALQASELRLKALEGTQAAVLQSQVESDSALLLVEEATNRRDSARRRLASVVGTSAADSPQLEDAFTAKLPTLDWETVRSKLMADNPELAALQTEVEAARWAVQRESAGRIPNVTVMSGAQYDNASEFAVANVQVSLPLPIYNRNQGNIVQANGRLTAAQAALDGRELALTQQLAAAMSQYITASRRVAKYSESILPAARQSLDLVTQAYQQGELAYLDILATQRTYTEKNLDYLNNLETAWKQWALVDGQLVGPLPDTGN
jgi:cobalt-zinc-cadmium efflux system outer membrane protein